MAEIAFNKISIKCSKLQLKTVGQINIESHDHLTPEENSNAFSYDFRNFKDQIIFYNTCSYRFTNISNPTIYSCIIDIQ